MSTKNGVKGFRQGWKFLFILNFLLLLIKGISIIAGEDFNMTVVMILETCIIGLVLFVLWLGFDVWKWGYIDEDEESF